MAWADRIICQLVLKERGEPAESNAMFRTAAALFAKKTAIVAITGVTVIGGASLALANGSTATDPVDDTTTTTESTTTTTESTTTTTESTTTTVAEPTTTTTTEAPLQPAGDDGSTELDDEGDADGHGAQVSEAARVACHKAENIEEYGNHGQCVKAFAHGEGVDHSDDGGSTDTLNQTDPEPAAAVAPAPAPKPAKEKPAAAQGGGKAKKG